MSTFTVPSWKMITFEVLAWSYGISLYDLMIIAGDNKDFEVLSMERIFILTFN